MSLRKVCITVFICALVFTLACTQFHTRMFEYDQDRRVCAGDYCFQPRILAYQDVIGEPEYVDDSSFFTSVRVVDISIDLADSLYDEEYADYRDSVAQATLDRMTGDFYVDSVTMDLLRDSVVEYGPDSIETFTVPMNERIAAPTLTDDYKPLNVNYITYDFGRVEIPSIVTRMFVNVHFHRANGAGDVLRDSVRFIMNRDESHGAGMFIGRQPPTRPEG